MSFSYEYNRISYSGIKSLLFAAPGTKMALRYVLKNYEFEFSMEKEQEDVINQLLKRRDCFVVLPTVYGKSLLYIILPLILNYVSIFLGRIIDSKICSNRIIVYE